MGKEGGKHKSAGAKTKDLSTGVQNGRERRSAERWRGKRKNPSRREERGGTDQRKARSLLNRTWASEMETFYSVRRGGTKWSQTVTSKHDTISQDGNMERQEKRASPKLVQGSGRMRQKGRHKEPTQKLITRHVSPRKKEENKTMQTGKRGGGAKHTDNGGRKDDLPGGGADCQSESGENLNQDTWKGQLPPARVL